MTNEQFLVSMLRSFGIDNDLTVHAKKLVEALESAKDVAENPHNNFDKILILRGKLQDLERD